MLRKEIESVILVHEENIKQHFKETKPAYAGQRSSIFRCFVQYILQPVIIGDSIAVLTTG